MTTKRRNSCLKQPKALARTAQDPIQSHLEARRGRVQSQDRAPAALVPAPRVELVQDQALDQDRVRQQVLAAKALRGQNELST